MNSFIEETSSEGSSEENQADIGDDTYIYVSIPIYLSRRASLSFACLSIQSCQPYKHI